MSQAMPRQDNDVQSDAQLVEAAIGGEREAFGVLYDRYARLVRAVCFDATGQLSPAQDLAQEVFLRGYAKLHTLRDREKFGAWQMSIARRVCAEWHRQRAGERRRFSAFDTAAAGATTTDFESVDEHRRLHEAIAQLDESQRIAVHLFYLEEHPAERARRILGVSRSGFYKLLTRARQSLARMLKHEESMP